MPLATVLDAQLVHGSDGWTTLKSTRLPPKTLNSSSSCEQQHASAADRARCCKRHPKACLSSPRAGGARRAGGVRLRDDLFVIGQPDPDSLVPVVRAYEACAACADSGANRHGIDCCCVQRLLLPSSQPRFLTHQVLL